MNNLNYQVRLASHRDYIIPGFNVFGYEDALAVIHAAESYQLPVMLMVNRDANQVMGVEHWAALLGSLAKSAKVPVGIHLDHCDDIDLICHAVDCGFTSVMYDGSHSPLEENIRNTRKIADYAHRHGVAVEAEVGTVPYSDKGETTIGYTDIEEARRMSEESGADWLAVSVGNVHRLTTRKQRINFELLHEIEKVSQLPLVLHGSSGVLESDMIALRASSVGKVNIGTALRQAFGSSLRKSVLSSAPEVFDRLALLKTVNEDMEAKAKELIKLLVNQEGE